MSNLRNAHVALSILAVEGHQPADVSAKQHITHLPFHIGLYSLWHLQFRLNVMFNYGRLSEVTGSMRGASRSVAGLLRIDNSGFGRIC